MSQMRMQNQIGATLRPDVAYHMDVHVQHEIKQVSTLELRVPFSISVQPADRYHEDTYVPWHTSRLTLLGCHCARCHFLRMGRDCNGGHTLCDICAVQLVTLITLFTCYSMLQPPCRSVRCFQLICRLHA